MTVRSTMAVPMLLCVFIFGCIGEGPEDPAVVKKRGEILLSTEPQGAVGVLEARQAVDQQNQSVVVVGRVGAGPNTWDPGKAAFVVADPSAPMKDHHHDGHDHENCPFCNADGQKAPDPTALVQVVDEDGAILSIDARKLLKLKENQLVVVQGQGQIDELGHLVVSANGIYIRN